MSSNMKYVSYGNRNKSLNICFNSKFVYIQRGICGLYSFKSNPLNAIDSQLTSGDK